jgi:hypothetical protein
MNTSQKTRLSACVARFVRRIFHVGGKVDPVSPLPSFGVAKEKLRPICTMTKTGQHIRGERHDFKSAAKCAACGEWYDF